MFFLLAAPLDALNMNLRCYEQQTTAVMQQNGFIILKTILKHPTHFYANINVPMFGKLSLAEYSQKCFWLQGKVLLLYLTVDLILLLINFFLTEPVFEN